MSAEEHRAEFIAQYQAHFGKFPIDKETAGPWYAFIGRLPADMMVPVIEAVAENNTSRALPRLREFKRAWRHMRPQHTEQRQHYAVPYSADDGFKLLREKMKVNIYRTGSQAIGQRRVEPFEEE